MRKRFAKRTARRGPSDMQWADVSVAFATASATVTEANVLVQLQAPTSLANLTADPPEDLTILRMVGNYQITLSAAATSWTLALLVADVTWTPGASIAADNDKRILWQKEYRTAVAAGIWSPPGGYSENGAQQFPCDPSFTHLDISPRVKVTPGKALYIVSYENTAAGDLTVQCASMRVLYRRSGRR